MSATHQADVDNEPHLFTVFMPGCPKCKAKHPMARTPPVYSDTCPDCGTAVKAPGEPTLAEASFTGWSPSVILGRMLRALGRALQRFAERL